MSMMKTRSNGLKLQFRKKYMKHKKNNFIGSEHSEALEYVAYGGFGMSICCNKEVEKYLQELHQDN